MVHSLRRNALRVVEPNAAPELNAQDEYWYISHQSFNYSRDLMRCVVMPHRTEFVKVSHVHEIAIPLLRRLSLLVEGVLLALQ